MIHSSEALDVRGGSGWSDAAERRCPPQMTALPTPAEPVPTWFREPSMARRLCAAVIDSIITAPLLVALQLLLPRHADMIAMVALRGLYEVVLVARSGQTVGKAVVGTKIVMLADSSIPSPRTAAIRWIVSGGFMFFGRIAVEPLGFVLGLMGIVVLIPILQPPLHRGLHDRCAGTVVTLSTRRTAE